MTLLQEALKLTAERGEDFWASLMVSAHHGGIVILMPECILIAHRETPDTLLIWLAMGEGFLPRLVGLAPPEIRWLKWQRGIRLAEKAKVGQFDFNRVKRLCALSHRHHELQRKKEGSSAGPNGRSAATGDNLVGAEPVD